MLYINFHKSQVASAAVSKGSLKSDYPGPEAPAFYPFYFFATAISNIFFR